MELEVYYNHNIDREYITKEHKIIIANDQTRTLFKSRKISYYVPSMPLAVHKSGDKHGSEQVLLTFRSNRVHPGVIVEFTFRSNRIHPGVLMEFTFMSIRVHPGILVQFTFRSNRLHPGVLVKFTHSLSRVVVPATLHSISVNAHFIRFL
jgi:hypothetical protein